MGKYIKVNVDYNNYNNTVYTRDFETLEELPKAGDVYYEDDWTLQKVLNVKYADVSGDNNFNTLNRYDFYEIEISTYDKEQDTTDIDTYYIAIEREEEV